jgi:hypothetical protein
MPDSWRSPLLPGRGPAITSMVNRVAVAALLGAGLTVTACSAASAPASLGATAAAPAQQGTGDSVCTAIASQASSITSQIANAGSYSAQVPVWQAWEGDLQAAAQKTQNSLVQGALQDVAAGVQNIISDEQNLMDGSTSDDTQLNDAFSAYQADVGDLETACGLPS